MLKDLVKFVVRPVRKAYRTLRSLRYSHLRYWKGGYPSFDAAPRAGGGFNSRKYVRTVSRADIEATRSHGEGPIAIQTSYLLPTLASTVARGNSGRLRMLDFGGAIGMTYLDVRGTVTACTQMEYHVVELEWACQEGARLFADDDRIRFHRSPPPPELPRLDIVYAAGVLMYQRDYATLLRTLCGYRARYILFETLAAGPFPTFVSTQVNIGPGPVPHWFFNLDEIVRLVEGDGYTAIFRNAEPLTGVQDNFDPKYQLDQTRYWTVLFEKQESASGRV